MKITRPICCGMDVHKNFVVATIGTTDVDTRITEYIQEEFSTLNSGLYHLRDWLLSHNCFEVCMESTGKYWIPIFNILEDNLTVYLTHPKYVKAIKGKKTDKKDSKWICDLFKHDLIKFSFIPPKEIRALREICRYRFKLVCMRSSERNRYQNCMTVSNIGLASVVSNPFGKTATAVMKEVLTSDNITEEKIRKLIHGGCRNKDKILDSIKGSKIESDQLFKMNESLTHMEELTTHIESCELEMIKRVQPFLGQCQQLKNLAGLGLLSSIIVISEIGVNMKQFDSAKQLCSWAGLAPTNNESAGKKKTVRISRAGQYLKPILVQCALGAVKAGKKSYFGRKYLNIKKRRGHKKAIIAVARKILVCIYHMVLTGEEFHPSDYETVINYKEKDTKQLTDEEVMKYLENRGVDISNIHFSA